MHGLDLFSGIGGISLALGHWVRTIAYCERDRYAQSVLLSRMLSGELDRAPIWNDITSLRGSMLPRIDIIFGGFPCQDISVAGHGEGLAGQRSGLFFEIVRLAKETRASFVFLENVPAIRTRGLREVVRAFTEMGYDCRWTCLSASSLGAPHKRERWFLLAHTDGDKLWDTNKPKCEPKAIIGNNGEKKSLADSKINRSQRLRPMQFKEPSLQKKEILPGCASQDTRKPMWKIEPSVGRVVDGLQFRVDRIKCLGNAVVPLQARTAFEKLMGLDISKLD